MGDALIVPWNNQCWVKNSCKPFKITQVVDNASDATKKDYVCEIAPGIVQTFVHGKY